MSTQEHKNYNVVGTADTSKIEGKVTAATIMAIVGQKGDSQPDIAIGADKIEHPTRNLLGKTDTDTSVVAISANFQFSPIEDLKISRWMVILRAGDESYSRDFDIVSLQAAQ